MTTTKKVTLELVGLDNGNEYDDEDERNENEQDVQMVYCWTLIAGVCTGSTGDGGGTTLSGMSC